ncbi:MSMEG_1061 family FMN-dependent PPOX-type flavoprotein [Gorillibacterium massiliense]|uniref:MSMEG_1061 family FMN-dependent PPOX-type flavoprotein n=1 Tax=Gorillibacterium massiliense TaxID=1280390 RepID=UPI0004B34F4E|nr:MSMEG_1061 family FMN-dependent PPOX-type flavoprotein [Gorillibacterium massiliense]
MEPEFFKDIIDSPEELRSMFNDPSPLVENKVISCMDNHCREFIAKSPIVFIATSDSSGNCDVSPRGDAPGFVLVLDENHLVVPERPGNRRFDSLGNIIQNPKIGLIFIIPGLEETLRLNGKARVIKDKKILQRLEAYGKVPMIGIGVEVEEGFIQCAKAFKRSNLWDYRSWPDKDDLPKPSAIIAEHTKKLKLSEAEVASSMKESYEKRLY